MPRLSLAVAGSVLVAFALTACTASDSTAPHPLASAPVSLASGGSGGSGGTPNPPSVDQIKVSKCYTNATLSGGGQMLIKASSSDATARLYAYRPDGSYIGEVQNGGGSRYGGTVMPYQPYDPVYVTIKSSSGGTITVPTTPFQP